MKMSSFLTIVKISSYSYLIEHPPTPPPAVTPPPSPPPTSWVVVNGLHNGITFTRRGGGGGGWLVNPCSYGGCSEREGLMEPLKHTVRGERRGGGRRRRKTTEWPLLKWKIMPGRRGVCICLLGKVTTSTLALKCSRILFCFQAPATFNLCPPPSFSLFISL